MAWYSGLAALLAAVTIEASAQPLTGGLLGRGGSSLPATTGNDGKVLMVSTGGAATEWAAVAGTGTVTSVGNGTVGPLFAATWATATTTPALSLDLVAKAANCVIAGPTTGADAVPTCRSLVALDLGNFTLAPSLARLTLQDAGGDTTPLTVRASGGAGTAYIAQFQASDNTPLSYIAHDGKFVGNVTGNVSGTSGSTTGNAATASDGLSTASGTAPLTLTLAAKGLTGSVADMTAASAGTPGTKGLVPAPAAGDQAKFLRGDATWQASAGGGITNGAGANVLVKSDGTNVVASTITDDATVVTINTRTTARATILTDGTGPALGVTATLPASPSAAVAAMRISATGAGNASQQQNGLSVSVAAGYTGDTANSAVVGSNATASSVGAPQYGSGVIGVHGIGAAASASGRVNIGVKGSVSGTGAQLGDVGVFGFVERNRQYGVVGLGNGENNGATPTGVLAVAANNAYAFPASGVGAALIAANGTSTNALFYARDNTTNVFTIEDNGYLTATVGAAGTAKWGVPAAAPQAYTHGLAADARAGTDTNTRGAKATQLPGIGTGTGGSGDYVLQTAPPGTTGTAANTPTDRLILPSKPVVLTESSATAVLDYAVAAGSVAGGTVWYTIRADDATDFQALRGQLQWAAVNKAGTLTATVGLVGSEVLAASTGTLTNTATITTGTNSITINLNAVSSLTQTTLYAFVSSEIDGTGLATTK